ncbi:hypothetical protein FTX61_11820 [Nitriliruptoraceae bacterium ZYF776]|nr:hypothetical protein [Profundirhabdus halotolerans]
MGGVTSAACQASGSTARRSRTAPVLRPTDAGRDPPRPRARRAPPSGSASGGDAAASRPRRRRQRSRSPFSQCRNRSA